MSDTLSAAQVPPPILTRQPSVPASTIAEMARQAVDEAFREAIAREVARRRGEIVQLVPRPGPSLDSILDAVSKATGWDHDTIAGGGRRETPVVLARWLFIYITASIRRDLSLTDIADALHMNRSSIIYALAKFKAHRPTDTLTAYCAHPALASLMAQADRSPRR